MQDRSRTTALSHNFEGLCVVAFESRRADDMARLIQKHGGVPKVTPSMRELPFEENQLAIDFANRLIAGKIDVIIFLTGVGIRYLIKQIESNVDLQEFLTAVRNVHTIARGPKPLAALRELGIQATYQVPEPNTWRELLATLDAELPVANLVVALQEYGITNPNLTAGLEARGAIVDPIRVYEWGLPEDPAMLIESLQQLASGASHVVLFTSANQVRNLLKVADDLGIEEKLRTALRKTVVGSIGPTTSEMLRSCNLPIDLEPQHPKMGPLVQAAAERAATLLSRKQQITIRLTADPGNEMDTQSPWYNSPFLKACRLEPTEFTPVWLMRQAGRYLPEYRAVRANTSFLELCKNPSLCSEVMCTTVERLGVDAAIIFSDLLPILEPMGMQLEFSVGEGPVIHNPLRDATDVDRVMELESTDSLHFVMETVEKTRADLPDSIPLIGFAGAPFTLASYAIEGGSSRSFLHTKTLMYHDESAWNALMQRLARAVVRYVNAQIASGAQAIQLFDSWAGCLGPLDYRKYVLPVMKKILAEITPGIPVISFATGNPSLLPLLAEAGPHVVGVDWRIEMESAWELVGEDHAVQGNLDPLVLLADRTTIRQRTTSILNQVGGKPGHIFNLGHGVLPQTPPDNARALVDIVHEISSQRN